MARRREQERRWREAVRNEKKMYLFLFVCFFKTPTFNLSIFECVPQEDTIDINFQSDLMAIFEENLF